MKEILGRKIGMTRVFNEAGEAVPVTVIEAGPCPVVAVRTVEKNGYDAYQVGFGQRQKSRLTKPVAGQFARTNVEPTRYLREIRFNEKELKVGDMVDVNIFKAGEKVDVAVFHAAWDLPAA